MIEKCFVDSNVWIYFLSDGDPAKTEQASAALTQAQHKVVSWQVINEVCFTLARKKGMDESFVRKTIDLICESCEVVDFNVSLLEAASHLRAQHSISFWDSLIVAAALAAECDTLFSEDLQSRRRYGKMTVQNIFEKG